MERNLNRWHAMMPKRTMAEKALGKSLKYMGQNPDKNAWYAMKAIDLLTTGEKQGLVREWLNHWMREDGPGRPFLNRVIQNTHPLLYGNNRTLPGRRRYCLCPDHRRQPQCHLDRPLD